MLMDVTIIGNVAQKMYYLIVTNLILFLDVMVLIKMCIACMGYNGLLLCVHCIKCTTLLVHLIETLLCDTMK